MKRYIGVPQRRIRQQRGVSAVELLAGIALLAMGMMIVPSMSETIDRQRAAGVTRQLASQVRLAQTRAVTTGWEYRVVGFPAAATNGRANQYRLIGRSTSASPWISALSGQADSATQYAGPWINLSIDTPGIDLNPAQVGGDAFWVTFGPRGAVLDRSNFTPMSVATADPDGKSWTMTVSTAGKVTIQ